MHSKYKKYIILCFSIFLLIGCTNLHENEIATHVSSNSTKISSLNSLYSEHAILIELDTNILIYSKLADEKVSPASLTKIMSAIIAIEYYEDYDSLLSIKQSVLDTLLLENSSLAGFSANEKVTIKDLLYGTLLSSGGEATLTLANTIAGSEEQFVELMNQKAVELKLINTHFTNACGFDDQNHYSTVKDISTLLRYCLKNETFKEIFTTRRYYTNPSNTHPNGITLSSTMFDNISDASLPTGEILGGKTGYTQNANLCLASLATINNTLYIFVSTNAKGNHTTSPYHIIDAFTAYKSIEEKTGEKQ